MLESAGRGAVRYLVCLAAVSVLLAAALGCAPRAEETDAIQVEMRVTPQPPKIGKVQVEIELRDPQGRPLAAESLELQGTMTHPGMRPSLATAHQAGPGLWQAELDLTMGGDWVVLVEARLADGRRIHRGLPLPGVEAP